MRSSLLLSLSLALLAVPAACAQTADDFFNRGAQFYISNRLAQAQETVTNGLSRHPGDIKLKNLEELLKRQNQSQSSQQQNQQRNQQQSQQQQAAKQNQKQRQQQAAKPEEKKNDQESGQQQARKASGEEKKEPASTSPPGQMTPREAERLLDSQKDQEMTLPVSRRTRCRLNGLRPGIGDHTCLQETS